MGWRGWRKANVKPRELVQFVDDLIPQIYQIFCHVRGKRRERGSAGLHNINAPAIGRQSEARPDRLKINYHSVQCRCGLNWNRPVHSGNLRRPCSGSLVTLISFTKSFLEHRRARIRFCSPLFEKWRTIQSTCDWFLRILRRVSRYKINSDYHLHIYVQPRRANLTSKSFELVTVSS